jgi:hypothetical protein
MASSSAAAGSFVGKTWQSPCRRRRVSSQLAQPALVPPDVAQALSLPSRHSCRLLRRHSCRRKPPSNYLPSLEDHPQAAVFCVSCWRRLQGSINRSKRRLYKHQSPERKRRAKRAGQHREPQARRSTMESEPRDQAKRPIGPNRRDRHSCRSIAAKRRREAEERAIQLGLGTSIPALPSKKIP